MGVCVSSQNNSNKVIKLNQLDENVIDNFNYEEYAVDKEEDNNEGKHLIHEEITSNNEERKKIENEFENENKNKNKNEVIEEKKEEEKKEENITMIQEIIQSNQD